MAELLLQITSGFANSLSIINYQLSIINYQLSIIKLTMSMQYQRKQPMAAQRLAC